MKYLATFVFFLCSAGLSFAQTPAPEPTPSPVSTFAISTSAISLPGHNETLAGAETGVVLQVTPNVALRQTNFLSSGAQVNGYFGGVDYTIAKFSKFIDNKSPYLAGYNFKLQVTASAGASRIANPTTNDVIQHWAFLAGGRLSYAPKGSQTFSLAIEVQDLNTPGLAKRNNLVVALGPSLHF